MTTKFRQALLATTVVLALQLVPAYGQPTPSVDWPGWRGPNANGVADGRRLPSRWSRTENVRWSTEIPGWGTSSPVVHGDRVYVTSEDSEGGRKSLLTLCYRRGDGQEMWRRDFGFGVDQRTHEKSNLAVNTPAVTEESVYVAFGNADVACYTHDGQLNWVKRYIPQYGDPKMAWGYGLSPVVLDDSVLFPWDHHTGPCLLIGLNKADGRGPVEKRSARRNCACNAARCDSPRSNGYPCAGQKPSNRV